MLSINLDPELEMTLKELAQREHISPDEIIKRLVSQYVKQNTVVTGFGGVLPELACFKNKDPLQLQNELRNEWD